MGRWPPDRPGVCDEDTDRVPITQVFIVVIDIIGDFGHFVSMSNRPPRVALSTKDRLIELLQWEPQTVEALAAEVGLTLNGVRAQLTVLERDGLVERAAIRPTGRVGKPPVAFQLTARAREGQAAAYPAALGALVSELSALQETAAATAVLAAAGGRLASASGRATDAVAVLEQLGAVVRRSVDADGCEVVEGASCPLAAAVRTTPLTCELVRALVAARLGEPVAMRCRHGDAPACRFAIGSTT